MNILRQKIYLAALLHDIGKFYQRSDKFTRSKKSYFEMLDNEYRELETLYCPKYKNEYSHKHVLWTAQFIGKILKIEDKHFTENNNKDESLIGLAAKHHNPSNFYEYIITLADHLSSSADRNKITEDVKHEDDWGNYKTTPLHSIFEVVGQNKQNNKWHFRLPVSILNTEKIMPVKKEDLTEMEKLYADVWNKFEKEIQTVFSGQSNQLLSKKNNAETLYYLLQKYLVNIPSSTQDIPDVSLFDHSKITAAFALNLFDYTQENNITDTISLSKLKNSDKEPFLLLGADLSGIQKYLYNIKSKFAAKNLKGRSFMLHLIMTSVVQKIIDQLNLYQSNLIYNSGGTFFILLPNTQTVKTQLTNIFNEVEEEFLNKFGAQLYLAHALIPFSVKDVFEHKINFIWSEIFKKIAKDKNQRYKNNIEKNYERFFEPFGNPNAEKDSITGEEITGESIKKDELLLDKNTYAQIELGKKLKNAKYWYIIKNGWSEKETDMNFLGYAHILTNDEDLRMNDLDSVIKYRLNDTHFINKINQNIQGFEFYGGNDYPVDENGNPKTFDLLTDGNYNKIGIVRMDVDNLGYLFKNGLRKEQKTFSRYASLSRNLDLFFRAYINSIWKNKSQYKEHIFILYSGGDDLFILGDWDYTLKFAEEVRSKFREFVCQNPYITISGGELIVPPKYPILKSAEQAGNVEKLAKNYQHKTQKLLFVFEDENYQLNEIELPKQKDAFAFLGTAMGWESEYIAIKKKGKEFFDKINNQQLPKGFLQKIIHYHNRKKELRTIWLMSYDFKRMKERYKKEEKYIDEILKDILNKTWEDKQTTYTMDSFQMYAVAARWAELLYRNLN